MQDFRLYNLDPTIGYILAGHSMTEHDPSL